MGQGRQCWRVGLRTEVRLSLLLLLFFGSARSLHALVPPTAAGAPAYIAWLEQCLRGLEQQLPAIARSAEEAARVYVAQDYGIRVAGAPGVASEATGRSGGLMQMNRRWPHAIVLNFPTTPAELLASPRWRTGHPVITFAPDWMRPPRRATDWPDRHSFVTHAALAGGLFPRPDGSSLVALDGVAAVAALWVWTGEFVGAVTRLGKMPCMYKGFALPGGKDRAERLGATGVKFHSERPHPVPPGEAGAQYLAMLRHDLAAVYGSELGRVQQLAEQAVATRKAGHTVYLFPLNHVLVRGNHGGPFDPGYFTRLNDGWHQVLPGRSPAAGDFVFVDGFDSVRPVQELVTSWRAAGARLAWSLATYDIGAGDVGVGELLIDQHWRRGDAVVEVPGYDIKILPTSGVIGEAILRLVEAEMVRLSDVLDADAVRPHASK